MRRSYSSVIVARSASISFDKASSEAIKVHMVPHLLSNWQKEGAVCVTTVSMAKHSLMRVSKASLYIGASLG